MLTKSKAKVVVERSTRKAPLTDADARALLAAVDELLIARGRQIERRPVRRATLADLKGPTGNYRAPMLRRGKTLLVGFHAETLDELFGR